MTTCATSVHFFLRAQDKLGAVVDYTPLYPLPWIFQVVCLVHSVSSHQKFLHPDFSTKTISLYRIFFKCSNVQAKHRQILFANFYFLFWREIENGYVTRWDFCQTFKHCARNANCSRIYHKSLTQMLFRVSFYAWKKVVSTEERENVNIRLGSVIQFLICP